MADPEIVLPPLVSGAGPARGQLLLRLHVAADGAVDAVEVLVGELPEPYLRAVVEAYRQARVRPAEIDGRRTGGSLDIVFRLD